MKIEKLTPGEQLYQVSNNIDFWTWFADKKENDKKVKAERKIISDAKYQATKDAGLIPEKEAIVISENAPKYNHGRFGIGSLVCENETTITISFNGNVQKMLKAFTKLELVS